MVRSRSPVPVVWSISEGANGYSMLKWRKTSEPVFWVQRFWNQSPGDESDYDVVETAVLQPTTNRVQCKPVPVLITSTVGCAKGDEISVDKCTSLGWFLVRVLEAL